MKAWIFSILLLGVSALAETQPPNVKYSAGKDINFEELVIDGQLRRPEVAVVTGDGDENGNGLLRLRENFVDRLAEDAGEDAP